ncbi:hypothetical protein IQ37_11840 [Chryseobacterium piperi]|uniref:DUF4919 domain-containing protein n=1 Tax=Chryseobacterium piperi TaxID=558152 RepID=A0A086BB15_9FLAO|nr:DUF4919 domain-containing protein [Chryseobacterium piperi]ASW75873.1 DUF4919 domain-containing protein [Chryseobacterium piperi]KFF26129.1 hypothetical protein IQ37_11840 [Chryseobacterium piperi]
MKKYIISSILVLIFQVFYAQINTDLIKKNVTENPQENFYKLLDIFKVNPSELTQEQLNQLYYGSKFVKIDYTIGNYNRESGTFWKPAQKRLSKNKAEQMVAEAESKYSINPLNKNLLDDMMNIYRALNETQKEKLCSQQKDLIIQTIEKSGDGKSEETAICVLTPGEVLQQLDILARSGPRAEFSQKMKHLPDGSVLTIYKIGKREVFVKLVGGYFL